METTTKPNTSWTPAEEARIAEIMATQPKPNRGNAIRKMRSEQKGSVREAGREPSKAQVAKQDAAIKRVNKAAAERQSISAQKQHHIDELVNSVRGKAAVEGVYKSSLSENFTRYIWYGMSNGRVLSVNPDEMTTRWLDPDSKSAKGWQRMQARAAKREEKAAAAKAK